MTTTLEMSADPAMTGRVKRQAAVSAVALGAITLLAAAAGAHPAVVAALGLGWALMPPLLALSVRSPRLRYGLVVPATLVSAGLVALVATALPDEPAGRIGWLLVTAGVLAGGMLGTWFWYRLLPVPRSLNRPLAAGRWALIAAHVALVVAGLVLVVAGRLA